MKLYSSILGLPIFCSNSETKIGIVKDILFCSEKNLIFGCIVEERGIFSSIKYIPIGNIKKINETSVMADNLGCIKILKKPEEFCKLFDNKSKCETYTFVYSKDGELLGEIRDILFDFDNNKVEGYVVSKSFFDDIFSSRMVIKGEIEFDELSKKFKC